jgi:predicted nucleic acid-binding protein
LRFVFDSNVLISAALSDESTSRRAFDHALDRGAILLSLPALTELKEVLTRHKFRAYVTEDEVRQFLAVFAGASQWVEIEEPRTSKAEVRATSSRCARILTSLASFRMKSRGPTEQVGRQLLCYSRVTGRSNSLHGAKGEPFDHDGT